MIVFFSFAISLLLSMMLIWIIRRLSIRYGWVVNPRNDRWHSKPTPTLGGIGIYLAFVICLFLISSFFGGIGLSRWGLLAGSTIVFVVGLYDDFKKISPPAKLIGQIIAAALVIYLGYTTNFFTPKIHNTILAILPNILLTFIWLIGITNAINLLDNMDGLAAGIAVITTGFLSYLFWQTDDIALLVVTLALGGSILGFLFFNFPPASIFMGDSGSMFIGFTLAILAIARPPQASNVFAVVGVPTLLFLLPILDTILVAVTRILRGDSPVHGGKDHASHRLVKFGLSERQTLEVLYTVAVVAGIAAIGIEKIDYWISLILVPTLVISLALVTAYLGRIKVVDSSQSGKSRRISQLMFELTYRRHFLEILLDFFLIGISYYLAYWISSEFTIDQTDLAQFLGSLPVVYAGSFLSFFYTGIYRRVWRYVGVGDFLIFAKASLGSVVILIVASYFILSGNYLNFLFAVYGVILFVSLSLSRSSFKILDLLSSRQVRSKEERVLILGAGDAGEMAIRWILMNPEMGYHPVGIVDADRYNIGRQIHGIPILGDYDQIESIVKKKKINGIVLTYDMKITDDKIMNILSLCKSNGLWIRKLRLEFERME